jgi:AMP nucleosidase
MQDTMEPFDVMTPDLPEPELFDDARAAVDRLCELYEASAGFLRDRFLQAMVEGHPGRRLRAYYPEVRFTTASFAKVDSRLSFGHVATPGTFATTVTRPYMFRHYLRQQIGLLLANHGVKVQVGASDVPMPVHFAVANYPDVTVPQEGAADFVLRDVFDVPDLTRPTMTS